MVFISIIFLGLLGEFILNFQEGDFILPMHLCDWAAFVTIFSLIHFKQKVFELAYFWGFAGTLQAILTPDVKIDFPDLKFIIFFMMHSGIISSLIYLIIVKGVRPLKGAVFRVFCASQLYLLIALIVNLIFNTNYGYLSKKPSNFTLLNFMGPWPWYIFTLEVAALCSFIIYYLPFFIKDKLNKST